MENKETSFEPTFIHAERISVDNARCSYHGSEPELMVLLAITIKDLITHGVKKHRVYKAVKLGIQKAKEEKRGEKK